MDEIKQLELKLTSVRGKEKVDVLNELASAYQRKEPAKALQYGQEALMLAQNETINDKIGESKALNNLGAAYTYISVYDRALDYFLKSLKVSEEIDDKDRIAISLNNIGEVYRHLGRYKQSLHNYQKSLEIREELNDNLEGLAHTLNNIGIVYGELDDYEQSLTYHLKSLALKEKIDHKGLQAASLNNIGYVHYKLKNYDESLAYYQKSLVMKRELNNKNGMAHSLVSIGEVYKELGEYETAFHYLQEALQLAQEVESKLMIQESYHIFYEIYRLQENYQQALHYYLKYTEAKEDIFNAHVNGKIADLQTQYETEIYRLKNIELVHKNQQITEQKEMLRRANADLKKANHHLERVNRQKNEVIGIISHDLKNPLTLILGNTTLITQIGMDRFNEDEIMEFFVTIENSANRMLELIENLLDTNRLESGEISLVFEEIDLTKLVGRTVRQYQQRASFKKINLHFDAEGHAYYVNADQSATQQIIDNLVSNAIKYSPVERNVYLHLTRNNDTVCLAVRDEGQGLTEDDLQKLFGKFARLSAKPTGDEESTGLGLSIVKRLAEAMKVRVWAESDGKNKGATFFVEFDHVNHE